MNLERVVERLRDYRLKNERFDRMVGAVLSNEKAMRAARATVAAARFVSRRGQTVAAGDYDTVFFVAGEMRSGTSWLRHSLSDHPEIACGDRKSTRLNSSHANISYAVFCLKKKKKRKTYLLMIHTPNTRNLRQRRAGRW